MAPIHLQRRLWPKTACGKVDVLRSTQEWQWVDCKECLLRRPDAETPGPDVVVRVKQ